MSLSIFKYFLPIYIASMKLQHSELLHPWLGKNRDPIVTRLTCCACPPPPFSWEAFPGSNGNEWRAWGELGEGEKKVHLKKWLPQLSTQCSFPRYFGKGVVKDACLRKFSQGLIVNGCLIAKVVLDNNELVPNNDEQMPNNDGLVPNNKMAVA